MEYCVASFRKKQEERAYKIYVTDILKVICENTANAVNKGNYLTTRFYDIMEDMTSRKKKKEETADEIKARIRKKIGGYT